MIDEKILECGHPDVEADECPQCATAQRRDIIRTQMNGGESHRSWNDPHNLAAAEAFLTEIAWRRRAMSSRELNTAWTWYCAGFNRARL